MTVKKKYQFAIVGCGRIAQRHASLISLHGDLKAVCDVRKDRAEALATGTAAIYESIDSMLDQEKALDILVVCTPNGLHAEHSIKALQRGLHVLCEKPMCITSVAGYSMRDTAYFFRKKLFVVKQNRFNPPVQFVKQLLDEGKLGKLLSVQLTGLWNRGKDYFQDASWRGTRELDGGTLFTQFSHFIDLMLWLAGDVERVLAMEANLTRKEEIEFSDTQVATVRFTNGAVGTLFFSINAYKKNREGSLLLVGEKGTVKIGGEYLNTLEYLAVEGVEPPEIEAGNVANNYGFYEGSMSNHDKVYAALIASVESPEGTLVNAEEGLKTVAFIESLYHAAAKQSST